ARGLRRRSWLPDPLVFSPTAGSLTSSGGSLSSPLGDSFCCFSPSVIPCGCGPASCAGPSIFCHPRDGIPLLSTQPRILSRSTAGPRLSQALILRKSSEFIARKSGEKIVTRYKTDRKDCRWLAGLLRLGS